MFTQHHQADALHRDAADHHERHRLCWRQHVQQHRACNRRECESRHTGYEGAREYTGAEDQERGGLNHCWPPGVQLHEQSVLPQDDRGLAAPQLVKRRRQLAGKSK